MSDNELNDSNGSDWWMRGWTRSLSMNSRTIWGDEPPHYPRMVNAARVDRAMISIKRLAKQNAESSRTAND